MHDSAIVGEPWAVVQWLSLELRVWDFAKFYQFTIAVPASTGTTGITASAYAKRNGEKTIVKGSKSGKILPVAAARTALTQIESFKLGGGADDTIHR